LADLDEIWIGQLVPLGDSINSGIVLLSKAPDGVTGLNLNLGIGIGPCSDGQSTGSTKGCD
jgi:hypothetical protein